MMMTLRMFRTYQVSVATVLIKSNNFQSISFAVILDAAGKE